MSLRNKLVSFSASVMHFLKDMPVSIKVTAYYTLFLGLLLLLVTMSGFQMAKYLEIKEMDKVLLEVTVRDSRNEKAFDVYDRNVYLSIHNHEDKIVYGGMPEGFPQERPHFGEGPQSIKVGGVEYRYVDIPVRPPRELRGDRTDTSLTGMGLDLQQPRQGPFVSGEKYGHHLWVRGIMSGEAASSRWRTLIVTYLVFFPLFLIIVIVGGYRIFRRSFAPVASMSKAARAIGETGDLSQRLPVGEGSDEIHQMGRTMNHMLDQIEDLMGREKRFTSDVSHELRTPIAVIMAESEFGKDYAENVEEAKKEMGRIFDQARHMNRMIGQLLELTRLGNKRSVPLSPLDISAYVADIVTDYQKLPESRDITWDIQIEPNITVPTDQSLFMRIFINYLDNAMKFTRSRVKVCLYGKGNEVYLTVSDDGAGMDESTLKKIWDRLYQADASRSRKLNAGLGLGLSFVAAAAKLLDCRAYAESTPGVGSTFYLVFKR